MDGVDRAISSLLDSLPAIHNNNTRVLYIYIYNVMLHVLCIDGAFCTCLPRAVFLRVSDHIFLLTFIYIYKFVKILRLCTTATYVRLICVRAPRRRYFNSSLSAKIPPIKYVMCAIYI